MFRLLTSLLLIITSDVLEHKWRASLCTSNSNPFKFLKESFSPFLKVSYGAVVTIITELLSPQFPRVLVSSVVSNVCHSVTFDNKHSHLLQQHLVKGFQYHSNHSPEQSFESYSKFARPM